MRIRPPVLVSLASLLLLPAGLLQAQTSTDARPTLYRLSPQSSFEEGCFPPCECPLRLADGVMGTFLMTPAAPDPLFQVFKVTDVNWLVPGPGYRVTGAGTYRIGGEFARMHQLQLDLKVADREVQHYDSGLIAGGAEFPAIVLSIAMNNMICHDTVFNLQAKPVAAKEIVPFVLRGSSYKEGCYGPCLCVIVSHPMDGRFGLLPLNETDAGADFAVVDVGWLVSSPSTATATDRTRVTGSGIYRLSKSLARQRMILDLIENGRGPTRFDSGDVPGGADRRRIDVDVAANGFACFDRVYSIHARRRDKSTALQGLSPEPAPTPGVPLP
jgi:hypothetical protein